MSETPQSVLERYLQDGGIITLPHIREAIRAVLAENAEMCGMLNSSEILKGQVRPRAERDALLRERKRREDAELDFEREHSRTEKAEAERDALATNVRMAGRSAEHAKAERDALRIDLQTADDQLRALRELLDAWERAEGLRGCYSTAEHHDCRCDLDRRIGEVCTCGRAELETAARKASELLGRKP